MKNTYYINGLDAYLEYGLVFTNGTYNALLKPLKKKEPAYLFSFPDQNGNVRDPGAPIVFEAAQLSIPVAMVASSEADFWTKYNKFDTLIKTWDSFVLASVRLDKEYILYYKDIVGYDTLTPIKQANGKVATRFSISVEFNFNQDPAGGSGGIGSLVKSGVLKSMYTASEGVTVITIPALINMTLLMVMRSQPYEVITSGVPGNMQVLFNSTTGRLQFQSDYPMSVNEKIFILSQSNLTTVIPGVTPTSTHREVATFAAMQALLSGDNPLIVIEYTVREDETNGDVLSHYTHFGGNLQTPIEQDIIL